MMANSKDKKPKKCNENLYLFFLVIMGISLVLGMASAKYVVDKTQDAYWFEAGQNTELEKQVDDLTQENLRLAAELEIEKAKSHEYKLIMNNCYKNANNFDERFESMLDNYILAREEKTGSDYQLALCMNGINPYNYSN